MVAIPPKRKTAMQIDWTHFTPSTALAGGLLIGLAVALFALRERRILGVSGILGGVLAGRAGDFGWRLAFLAGLIAAPVVGALLLPLTPPTVDAGWAIVVIAGLLVGFGTRLGSGCTSGHGVCGLSRLSPRSLVATLVFMSGGMLTVFVARHVLG
jgi:uncharacterized membrane protein YedE/YeeE